MVHILRCCIAVCIHRTRTCRSVFRNSNTDVYVWSEKLYTRAPCVRSGPFSACRQSISSRSLALRTRSRAFLPALVSASFSTEICLCVLDVFGQPCFACCTIQSAIVRARACRHTRVWCSVSFTSHCVMDSMEKLHHIVSHDRRKQLLHE